MKIMTRVAALTLAALAVGRSDALLINYNYGAGITAGSQADLGFQAAASIWQSILVDPVTVNIDIDMQSLGAGILGSTGVTSTTQSYSAVRSALIGDALSANDAIATANLPAIDGGGAFDLMINGTSNNPNGPLAAAPYVDSSDGANNKSLRLTNANAKALGLIPGAQAGSDASITFSTNFAFDFDPGNGIGPGLFDFVGVAVHEIGHALGFISGVDFLDFNAGSPDDTYVRVSPMDLYRYSVASTTGASPGAHGAVEGWTAPVIDWTIGGAQFSMDPRYFSIDGGVTAVGGFVPGWSEGVLNGDGRQASHWKDNLGMGIMDPTADIATVMSLSGTDVMLFDVIGWDLQTRQGPGPVVPEPGTLALLAGGLVLLRRRRS